MQRLVLMADYDADPLWDEKTGAMVDLDLLPISATLRDRLRTWARHWETLANAALLEDASEDEYSTWAPLRDEQTSLWLALREELAGRYEVGLVVAPPSGDAPIHAIWSPGGLPELPGWFETP